MKHHLHFTFGPVQGFVSQARRTRDLYAGSLLLSHLAMSAMKAVISGKIILPNYDKLLNTQTEHAIAPNRFIAEFDSEAKATEAGRAAADALRAEWQKISYAVWTHYLAEHASRGMGTEEIWQRQVPNFWNIAWAVCSENEHDLLDRRKNWQTHYPPVEGGDHCVLMHQWQELSGFIRSQQRGKQDDFWQAVGSTVNNRRDLKLGERLCAVAFIKRFFPLIAKAAIGRDLDTRGWPSTVSIAALPWMLKVAANKELHTKAADYAKLVKDEPGAIVSSARRLKSLAELPDSLGLFTKLSGNFLNRTALENADDTPLRQENNRGELLDKLRALEKDADDRAGSFYAILLMDGDSMGALIRDAGKEKVTSALTQFATAVPGIIAEHDGITVYAGGDDLLALLPLDRVLDAACAAHSLYAESFGADTPATVSAAIVFAHYRCTFSRVLASAHELLDDVAKDRTGRDAIAIRVLKPGGMTCEWSAPFGHFMKAEPHLFSPLVTNFKTGNLSASLLYNLRERFTRLTDGDSAQISRAELHALFTAEALIGKQTNDQAANERERVRATMNQLLDVSEVMQRNPETKETKSTGMFTFDGPRLVKFLALDGKEGAE